jgi:hypothetical protein
MYLTADKVSLDDDEGRFTLEVETDEGDTLRFLIHHIDLDAFYDQVKGRLGPYLREAAEARSAVAAGISRQEYEQSVFDHERSTGQHAPFECSDEDIDESGGYAADDPKGPKYHSTHADIWDSREGK